LVFLSIGIGVLLLCGCKKSDSEVFTQGIQGRVLFYKGNFMPGGVTGTITAGEREIYIYLPTTLDDVKSTGYVFFSDIKTKLVAMVKCNSLGYYQVSLPAGEYSIFVKEKSLLYASRSDFRGVINPVEVVSGTITTLNIDITYEAYF